MTDPTIQTVVNKGLGFVDGLRWYQGKLWFSDFLYKNIFTVDKEGQLSVFCNLPDIPSGLGFTPEGVVLVTQINDRKVLGIKNNETFVHVDLNDVSPSDINDMVVDSVGRAYISPYGFDIWAGEEFRETRLIIVEPDGQARLSTASVFTPNGMTLSQDGRSLSVNETYSHQVKKVSITESGDLVNPEVLVALGETNLPDGAARDADDGIWVATIYGNAFIRINTEGVITDRISTGDRAAISCVLGGENGDILYGATSRLTTARLGEVMVDPSTYRPGEFETHIIATKVQVPRGGTEGTP